MKKKLKLSNGEKIFLIVLVIYVLIMLLVFLPNYLKKQNETMFIMTTRYKIKYEKGKWKKITNSDDYKLRKLNIYLDGDYFGEYRILYSNRFTLLNDNDEIVPYDGIIFAYSGSNKIKLHEISYNEEINYKDDEIVKDALSKIGITQMAYYNIRQKSSIDIDNDNKNEYIYIIDNYEKASNNSIDGITGPVANDSGKNFSVIFMYKNNKVYIIDKIITEDYAFKVFEVLNVIDIKEDNKLELIYNVGERYNTFSDCVKLYNLANNKEIHNFCQ